MSTVSVEQNTSSAADSISINLHPPAATNSLQFGELVADNYRVSGKLGQGAFGTAYLSYDQELDRWAVLKVMHQVGNQEIADMINETAQRERKFLQRIDHRNLVRMYGTLQHRGRTFTVLEFINGETLESLRQKRGAMAPEVACRYLLPVTKALSHLRERGLVHNDIKPANILVTSDSAKLSDLGSATEHGESVKNISATPGFAPPEVFCDYPQPSHETDLYQLARVLAYLTLDFDITGSCMFDLPTPKQEPRLTKAEYRPLYEFLKRATFCYPPGMEGNNTRCRSAEEMHDQLLAVIEQTRALKDMSPAA